MNVTELVASFQSQSAAGAVKAGAAPTSGLFQSLLADGLAQNGVQQQAADQLLDLISQLNSDQIAQLFALLGLSPQSQQVGSPAAATDGSHAGNVQAGIQPAFLQTGPQPAAGLLFNASLLVPAKNAAAIRNDAAVSQLLLNLSELLKQAGISAQDAVSQVQGTLKDGGDLAGAFQKLIEQAKLPMLQHHAASGQSANDGIAVIPDTAGLRQTGTQIRPEMLSEALSNVQTESPVSPKTESTNTAPAADSSTDTAEATGSTLNLTTPAFSLSKNQQAAETQPAAAHVKMSSEQFESDFPAMLVKQASLTERGGLSEMRVTLMPEGLGEIHVRVQGDGGLVSLQIAADSQHARSLLDANLGILKQHLEAQGMQLNRVEVVASNSSANMNSMDQGMFDGRSRQQQDTNQQQPNRQHTANSQYQFEEELMYQQAVNMQAGQYDWMA